MQIIHYLIKYALINTFSEQKSEHWIMQEK